MTRIKRVPAPTVTPGPGVDERGRRTWTIPLPFTVPLSLNRIVGRRWHSARDLTDPWRDATIALARSQRIPRLDRFTVVLHHAPRVPGEGIRDAGNYEGTLKPIVDGLVLAGVAIDDNRGRYVATDPVVYPPTGEPGRLWLVVVDLSADDPDA